MNGNNYISAQEAERIREELLKRDLTSEEREFVECITAEMLCNVIYLVKVIVELEERTGIDLFEGV